MTTDITRIVPGPAAMPDLRDQLIRELDAWEAYMPVVGTLTLKQNWSHDGLKFFLDNAQLWWVSAEMCELVYATMPEIPDGLLRSEVEAPCAVGMVVMEKPWMGMTVDDIESWNPGGRISINVVSWGHGLLAREGDPAMVDTDGRSWSIGMVPKLTLPELIHRQGENGVGTRVEAWHYRADHEPGVGYNPQLPRWFPCGGSTWPMREPVSGARDESILDDRRFLAALWTLIRTKAMGEVVEQAIPRHVRRREERAGRVPSPVKVVYLRRLHHDSEEPTGEKRHYSHRFVVRAHPVMQPYGPGRSKRKLIMRGPFIKGPDDAPLVVKETIRAWVR